MAAAGRSAQEVTQIEQKKGTSLAADVLDVGGSVATASTTLFAPYKVATWSSIPAGLKDPGGLYTGDYGGYTSVGYGSGQFGTSTSLWQLVGSKFKNHGAVHRHPTQGNAPPHRAMRADPGGGGRRARAT